MNLDTLFYPKSIAVIGASRKEKTVGNDIVKNLTTQGFDGIIYPVNPRAEALYGHKVYASTKDIKDTIDLIVVCVPAPAVSQVIEEAAVHNNTKAAIVISAGCKEMGNEALEKEVVSVCNKHKIAMIGPNCLGIINPEIKMNASFASIMPRAENVAFISQSGALCTSILDYANKLSLGFSKFLSIGNKAQIDELTLLRYFAADPKTKVIGMYVEQLTNAPEFIATVKEITRGPNAKPIIALKSGRTSVGAAAAASHTGSLTSSDAAYQALFEQAGVIRANTVRELLEYLDIFSQNPIKPIQNVTVITNAGGPGVLATDEIISHGLELTRLKDRTVTKLQSFLPKAANTHNPVDILGDAVADRYEETLKIIGENNESDAVLTILTPQSMTEVAATAQAIINFKNTYDKPIVASFMGQDSVLDGVSVMEKAQVSTTAFPELGARGLALLGRFSAWSQQQMDTNQSLDKSLKTKGKSFIKKHLGTQERVELPEAQAIELLADYGIKTLKSQVVTSVDEALKVAKTFSGKMVLKIVSPDILHKSDVGGVVLNVTADTLKDEYTAMLKTVKGHKPKARIEGVLMVEMAPSDGYEAIAGITVDPQLGSLIMFGLGGIYVEVFKDVSFGFAKLSEQDIDRMITSLKSYQLLLGSRGHQGYDIEAIKDTLRRLSALATNHPEIIELDINPLLVLPKGQGALALDARLVLQK